MRFVPSWNVSAALDRERVRLGHLPVASIVPLRAPRIYERVVNIQRGVFLKAMVEQLTREATR
jgi:hypothetical protein